MDAAAVLDRLDASAAGLPAGERARRLARYGPNAPAAPKKDSVLEELLEAATEPLQLLLLAVGVLSSVFGHLEDAIAIFVVIALVVITEAVTELRAAKAIDALRQLAAPAACIRCGGAVAEIPAAELVPGDVFVIEAGDLVPADARVIAAEGLRVDESTLTGEAEPAGKGPAPVPVAAPLAERAAVLYAGTAVAAGDGAAVVTATGPRTELGQLGKLVRQKKEPPTPLQRSLAQLAKVVLVFAVAASIVVPVAGLLTGRSWHEMLLDGLTIAFATVPEELPILVTVLLAVDGRQLARRGALLRRLRAGEALGSVTVVVTDKTGTLTRNRLQLAGIHGDRDVVLATALACQPPGGTGQAREPVETELAAAAAAEGISQPGEQVAAFPFDPARRLASRAWRTGDGLLLAVSGAPETVLARCALPSHGRRRAEAQAAQLAAGGLRVIGFAHRACTRSPPTARPRSTSWNSPGWPRSPTRSAPGSPARSPTWLPPGWPPSWSPGITRPPRPPSPSRPGSRPARGCTAASSPPWVSRPCPASWPTVPWWPAPPRPASCGSSVPCSTAARWWPSPATASTTLPRWPPRTSGSPWAAAVRTWPARPPGWYSPTTPTQP